MTRADILIAGGGIIGLLTAWTLARKGARVAVVDSGMPAATDAAAGMLSPSFERSLQNAALADFAKQSLARWKELAPLLAERGGVDCDFQEGVLSVAFDETEAAALGGDALTREETLALEPSLAPTVVAGVFASGDAQIDPRSTRSALERALQNDGGVLIRGSRVASIRSEYGRVRGALLADGEQIDAGAIIVATGARIEGLAELPKGAIFPVKGEALALAGAGEPKKVVRTRTAYLCPKADGRIVIGATEIPHDWSLTTDDERIDALKKGAHSAVPALKDAPELARWAGLRPATPDGAPIIGRAPDGPDGLFYALGHYRNGILLAPATAEALSDLILDGRADPAIAAFSAARFNELGVS